MTWLLSILASLVAGSGADERRRAMNEARNRVGLTQDTPQTSPLQRRLLYVIEHEDPYVALYACNVIVTAVRWVLNGERPKGWELPYETTMSQEALEGEHWQEAIKVNKGKVPNIEHENVYKAIMREYASGRLKPGLHGLPGLDYHGFPESPRWYDDTPLEFRTPVDDLVPYVTALVREAVHAVRRHELVGGGIVQGRLIVDHPFGYVGRDMTPEQIYEARRTLAPQKAWDLDLAYDRGKLHTYIDRERRAAEWQSLSLWLSSLVGHLPQIGRWVKATGVDLFSMSWTQAVRRSRTWQRSIQDKAVAVFPDGWHVVALVGSEAIRAEGVRMQNCLKRSAGEYAFEVAAQNIRLFSIRPPDLGKPGATARMMDLEIGRPGSPHASVRQCQARGNTEEFDEPYLQGLDHAVVFLDLLIRGRHLLKASAVKWFEALDLTVTWDEYLHGGEGDGGFKGAIDRTGQPSWLPEAAP